VTSSTPQQRLAALSDRQATALLSAASWYASYFSQEIRAEAGETAGYVVRDREKFLDLVAALRAVGIPTHIPDELWEFARGYLEHEVEERERQAA
jgi:hypothetical protein